MARSTLLIPGFRFHPTDVELAVYFLKRKLLGKFIFEAIAEVNIYDFSPWDLPDKSILRSRDLEWFFFCPKAKKYSSGSRTNRATEIGFWKATGKDRAVEYKQETVAMIKTLVFHLGHAPKGQRTDWVMHEYRMADKNLADAGVVQDSYVLCRIFEKSGAGPKNGAQYGAPFNEEEWNDDLVMATTRSTALNPYQSSAAAVSLPQSTGSWSIPEPGGPSSITMPSANERKVDDAASNEGDAMLTNEDIASIMGGSPLNGNNNDKEVEVVKDSPNEEDTAIYEDLANLSNLEDLNEDSFNIFRVDRDDYTLDLDAIFTAADLDFDLQ